MTEKEIETQRKLIKKVKDDCDMAYYIIHNRNGEGTPECDYYLNQCKKSQKEYEDFTEKLDKKLNGENND